MGFLKSFKTKERKKKPFVETKVGILTNTILGLPKAAKKVGGEMLRGTTRNIASAGLTLAKPLGGLEEISSEDVKGNYKQALFETVFGKEKIKDLPTRIAESEVKIKQSPTARRFGLDKAALPLAFGGVLGGTALDLTPFGGGRDDVVKILAKETNPKKVIDILKNIKVPEDVATRFADDIAKAVDLNQVDDIFETIKNTVGSKEVSEKLSPIGRLLVALDNAGTARKDLDVAQTAERASRAEKLQQVFTKSGGQEGYFEALGKLKGELAPDKKIFQQLEIDQNDADALFNQIQSNEVIDVFEKVSASNGLQKLLGGEIPPPSQLSLLEDVFGKELIDGVMKKRPAFERFKDTITEILNVPRSLITSFDMSAPLRQGVLFTITKPKIASGAAKEMFKQVFSPKNFDAWIKELPKHPNYKLMKDSNLYIANPNKVSGGLSAREEKFMTAIAEKIPVLGSIVKASERAYVSYLNKLRVDVFGQLTKQFIKDGIDPKSNPKVFKDLASFVNNGTGRGDLGSLNRVAQQLNTVFFSPRLIASRFNLLNPVWYAKQSPAVRKEAIKSFAQFVGTGATILTLMKASGAKVESDPRSSDFGKIRMGDTRYDIWGGFQQWVRVFSQLVSGQRKTGTGKVLDLSAKQYPFETRKDVMQKFFEGKLAPIPSLINELLIGQKLFGEEITLPNELYENAVPLYLQDLKEAIDEDGAEAIFNIAVPGFFGVGVQTYKDTKKKGQGFLNSF